MAQCKSLFSISLPEINGHGFITTLVLKNKTDAVTNFSTVLVLELLWNLRSSAPSHATKWLKPLVKTRSCISEVA